VVSTRVTVDPEAQANSVAELKRCAGAMRTLVQDYRKSTGELQAKLQGETASAYQRTQDYLAGVADSLVSVLEEMATASDQAAQSFVEVDNAAAAMVRDS